MACTANKMPNHAVMSMQPLARTVESWTVHWQGQVCATPVSVCRQQEPAAMLQDMANAISPVGPDKICHVAGPCSF